MTSCFLEEKERNNKSNQKIFCYCFSISLFPHHQKQNTKKGGNPECKTLKPYKIFSYQRKETVLPFRNKTN